MDRRRECLTCVAALPPSIQADLRLNDDADDFLVWSDDGFGDIDGDRMPEIPVSRVPDGRTANLLLRATLRLGQDRAQRAAYETLSERSPMASMRHCLRPRA